MNNDDVIKANTLTSTMRFPKCLRNMTYCLPVVDTEDRLVGIITVDDVMELIEEDTSEEMTRMTGAAPLENPYLKTGVFGLAKAELYGLC